MNSNDFTGDGRADRVDSLPVSHYLRIPGERASGRLANDVATDAAPGSGETAPGTRSMASRDADASKVTAENPNGEQANFLPGLWPEPVTGPVGSSLAPGDIWARMQDELKTEFGEPAFNAWLQGLVLETGSAPAGIAAPITLYAPTHHDRDFIRTRYWHRIVARFAAAGIAPDCLTLAARSRANLPATTADPESRPPALDREPGDPVLMSDDQPSFGNFVTSESNLAAFTQMSLIGEGRVPAASVIFLHGDRGMGKTHLAKAALRELARKGGRKALYLSAGEFRDQFVAASMKGDFVEFKRRTREADVLIIDDLHTIVGSTGTQEELFHSVRAVIGRQGPKGPGIVVLIADSAPANLNGLNDQLASDLQGALMLEIRPPDVAARREIAEMAMRRLAAKAPKFEMSDWLIDYVATKVHASARAVCGAIYSIFAKSLNGEQAVTRQIVDDVLRNQGISEKRVTIDLVQRVTCEFFGVSRNDLESPRRHAHIVHVRQIAMYLCREMTNHGFPMIGSKFGKRHHSTVIYSCKLVEESIRLGGQPAREIDQVRQLVRNRA